MEKQHPHIEIYTDGGADPNPGPGGWGAVLIHPQKTLELSGGEMETTNNRMELTAAVEALRALNQRCEIALYTDSQYVRRGITEWIHGWVANGWRRGKNASSQPVRNADLWQDLHRATQEHDITWHWVKGHSGNAYNERADQLATEGRPKVEEAPLKQNVTTVYLRISGKDARGPYGWAARVLRGDQVETLQGGHPDITANHFTIYAMLDMLNRLPAGEPLQIFTNNSYLYDGITQWVDGWRRRGWTKPDKFRAEWQLLDRLNQQRSIRWIRFGKQNMPDEFAALKESSEEARAMAETMTAPDPIPGL